MIIMRPKRFIIPVFLLANSMATACTVLWKAGDDQILAAKNQDYYITATRMLVQPAENGKYGVIYFGDKNPDGFCNTSGHNDQGLYYGGASVPARNDIRNTCNKPVYTGELIEKVLEECATVAEAITVFSTYFTPEWTGHYLLADRKGDAVVIEYGRDDVVFLYPDQNYQAVTNFYLSDTANARWNNCYRYSVAEYLFRESDSTTIELLRSICDATHVEGTHPTVLTTIHDLKIGDIQIYDFYNFEEVVKINLHIVLAGGSRYCSIREFFSGISLKSPEKDETIDPSTIEFRWYGDAGEYQIYYSTDPGFRDCVPLVVNVNRQQLIAASVGYAVIIAAVLLLVAGPGKKKYGRLMVLLLVVTGALTSCDFDILNPPELSDDLHCVSVPDLLPGAKYYWKVVGADNELFNSESQVSCFYTGEL